MTKNIIYGEFFIFQTLFLFRLLFKRMLKDFPVKFQQLYYNEILILKEIYILNK